MTDNQKVEELLRSNAELNALVRRFLADTDALFRSRTWSIGYRVATILRWLQRGFGMRAAQAHIGPGHFRKVAEGYFHYQGRQNVPVSVDDSGIPEVPKNYIVSDVDVVIRDLWAQVSRRRELDGQ